jgi:predicted DCC family thiol-disulfide oxidoreductase YuxK
VPLTIVYPTTAQPVKCRCCDATVAGPGIGTAMSALSGNRLGTVIREGASIRIRGMDQSACPSGVDTLYYDGQCPLCTAEMDRLRQLADPSLALVDIHGLDDTAGLPDRAALLERLHLRRADNVLLSGLDANVTAWQHTRFGFLWAWLRWPLLRPLADAIYNRWAAWRYHRLYGDSH